ncbi:SDR family NAD(P)-dependent oxidoreductase [Streptomyces olivaceus]
MRVSQRRTRTNDRLIQTKLPRRPEPLAEMTAKLQAESIDVQAFSADLSDTKQIAATVRAIRDHFGRIDVVEYSPITSTSPFTAASELTPSDLTGYVDLYLYSPIAVVNAVLPEMLERGDGAILVTQGGSAVAPEPFRSGVGPIMAATRNYLYSLHGELADQGVYAGTLSVSTFILGRTGASAMPVEALREATGQEPVDASVLADLSWELVTERDRVETSWPTRKTSST